jgi:hypothetical protein
MTQTQSLTWNPLLLDQLDFHWQHALRPRLTGLTDDEYLWEPVPGAWNVRPRGGSRAPVQAGSGDFTLDFAFPEPDPAPVTTIAWRLGHIVVGCLAMRSASHFGREATDYESWAYAGTAAEALQQLDDEVARWRRGVTDLGEEGLARSCGEAEGPYAAYPMAALVLHIHRELIHHGAEICLLRDLYLHSDRKDS